jgi:hypothetical protein
MNSKYKKISTSFALKFNILKPSGKFTCHQASHSKIHRCAHITFMCFVRILEQAATSALYNIKRLVFITEVESIYCAVRSESLYKTDTLHF